MNSPVLNFQIGKNGITENVVNTLDTLLKNHKHIRISLLKSSGRNRDTINGMVEELISKLKTPCKYTIIGFTIALRRSLR